MRFLGNFMVDLAVKSVNPAMSRMFAVKSVNPAMFQGKLRAMKPRAMVKVGCGKVSAGPLIARMGQPETRAKKRFKGIHIYISNHAVLFFLKLFGFRAQTVS